MQIRFDKTGAERKALVMAIGDILEVKPQYLGTPGFAYSAGAYTVDKSGTVESGAHATPGDVSSLLAALAERGFIPEDTQEQPMDDDVFSIDFIEYPDDGFSDSAFHNLVRLVTGKATLIRAAIGGLLADGAEALPVVRESCKVRFPWFRACMESCEIAAWTVFSYSLCAAAKRQKRVTLKEKPLDEGASEKFAMRCFLLKLGFIGDEYKDARRIILARLSGDGSRKMHKSEDVIQGDCLSCRQSMSDPGEKESDHDRLFCVERQKYVSEDGICPEFNQ